MTQAVAAAGVGGESEMSDTGTTATRRRIVAASLIGGQVLAIIGNLLTLGVGDEDEPQDYLAEVADQHEAYAIAGVLFAFGLVLSIVGIIGVVHLIRHRGATLALIGGGLLVLGLSFFQGLNFTNMVDAVFVEENISPDVYETLVEGAEDFWPFLLFLIPALAGTAFGLILFAAAIWRSGIAPVWIALIIAVAAPAFVLLPTGLVGDVLLLVGLGYLALKIWGMRDADWERPPDWGAGRASEAPPPPPAAA